jgi:hypothetical protein
VVGARGFEPPTSSSQVYIYHPISVILAVAGGDRKLADFLIIFKGVILDD